MCKEKHMYNHYPEQTKRNVVAVHRAGVRASTISRTLSIPRSTIMTWIESKEYMDVLPADETILGHFNTNTLLPAKAEKKANGFVKVAGGEPRQMGSSLIIKKGSMTVEVNWCVDDAGLISLIKAIGECNVL